MLGNAAILRVLLAFLLLSGPALAAESRALPDGLDVSANTETVATLAANGEQVALSLADLAPLPRQGADMETIWDMNGLWEGVSLSGLLDRHGVDPTADIRLRALDDYEVVLTRAEIDAGTPLLAFALNGAPIAADAMGPLMLVWPRHVEATLAGTAPLTDWIWSVDRIEAVQ